MRPGEDDVNDVTEGECRRQLARYPGPKRKGCFRYPLNTFLETAQGIPSIAPMSAAASAPLSLTGATDNHKGSPSPPVVPPCTLSPEDIDGLDGHAPGHPLAPQPPVQQHLAHVPTLPAPSLSWPQIMFLRPVLGFSFAMRNG